MPAIICLLEGNYKIYTSISFSKFFAKFIVNFVPLDVPSQRVIILSASSTIALFIFRGATRLYLL